MEILSIMLTKTKIQASLQSMFSYLDAVKKAANDGVYGRGIKYYLEGNVGKFTNLILDHWRLYRVIGGKEYLVKMPLLHLVLSPEKYEIGSEALSEAATCTCEYYQEWGICKHVVAVCASLEKEFNPRKKLNSDPGEVVLDQIFEVENEKQIRIWNSKVEIYFNSSSQGNPYWFEEIASKVAKNPETYQKFVDKLSLEVDHALKTWESELRVMQLIKQSLYFGEVFWWDYWQKFFPQFEPSNKIRQWVDFWKMYAIGIFKPIKNSFLTKLRDLPDSTKNEILVALQKDFVEQNRIWLDFIIESRYLSWLEQHLDTFDPISLFKIYNLLPDSQNEIEIRSMNQVKVWSDFLQPGNYREIAEIFKIWEKIAGRTEVFEQALKYLQENHPKKKKLLEMVGN